ncbi:Fur family transcriptional regulator [Acetobacter cerevisiae]|uniref:Fur family transcriptional regulator n=1 Tax=Acetobacter cerevisiae TaxID=178900 RepID=UPI002F9163A8
MKNMETSSRRFCSLPSRQCGSSDRTTSVRDDILTVLTNARLPLSAYDILRCIDSPDGRTLAPPTIYRALSKLMAEGLVARLESRNAFVHIRAKNPSRLVFCICEQCGIAQSVENEASSRLIDKNADSLGFQVRRRIIELQGLCSDCQSCPATPVRSTTQSLPPQAIK